MMHPIFYLMLIPVAVGVLAAAVVSTRKEWPGWGRVLTYFFLFAGGGLVITALLFFGFVYLYYAGGGH